MVKREKSSAEAENVAAGMNDDEEIVRKLRESELRFKAMFEQAGVGIAFASRGGQLLEVNRRYCEIVGYSRDELLRMNYEDITYPEDREQNRRQLEYLWNDGGMVLPLEKRYVRVDKSVVWASLSLSLIRDSNGLPAQFMAVIQDISWRKQIEQERIQLYEAEQRARAEAMQLAQQAAARADEMKATLRAITDAVIVFDQTGKSLFTNTAAQELFYDKGEAISESQESAFDALLWDEPKAVIALDDLPVRRILAGEVIKGKNEIDITFRTSSGKELLLSVGGAPVRNNEGMITGGVLIARDVTERRRLERRTHEALEGLLEMAEALVQLSEQANTNGLQDVGQQMVELTCSVLGCQRAAIYSVEPETEVVRPVAVIGLMPEQEAIWWEKQQAGEYTLTDSIDFGSVDRLRANQVIILDTKKPPNNRFSQYQVEQILVAPITIRERLVGFINLDYSGDEHEYTDKEMALVGTIAKLSVLVIERQRLLREQAEAEGREVALREAKLRMEEFLGIASHELRTPLTTIKANIQLAMRRLRALLQQEQILQLDTSGKLHATFDMLERAERQVGVLNRLVGDMIDISRIQSGKLQVHLRQLPCNLKEIVEDVVREQQKALPGRELLAEFADDEDVLGVYADPDRIAQVLTNYLSNAFKYSTSEKPVRVRVSVSGETVMVEVVDEGPGLSFQDQQRIWECFYQAEGVKVVSGSGVGLGLGLHISKTIIDRHNGQVGVTSETGKGSTFWFTLPLVKARGMRE